MLHFPFIKQVVKASSIAIKRILKGLSSLQGAQPKFYLRQTDLTDRK